MQPAPGPPRKLVQDLQCKCGGVYGTAYFEKLSIINKNKNAFFVLFLEWKFEWHGFKGNKNHASENFSDPGRLEKCEVEKS